MSQVCVHLGLLGGAQVLQTSGAGDVWRVVGIACQPLSESGAIQDEVNGRLHDPANLSRWRRDESVEELGIGVFESGHVGRGWRSDRNQ